MEDKQAVIYGVETQEGYKYIGKTIKSIRAERELRTSDVGVQYVNDRIKNIFTENPDINMVALKTIAVQEWYDEKLREVVEKHQDNHPLENADWMLEGKRGFWEGKKRDPHTLQRLSESKYKRVVQYDLDGNRIKIWNSGKQVATEVFRDYRVVNGAGCTRLYRVLDASTLKGKLKFGSYWFREAELRKKYRYLPKKLDIDALKKAEIRRKKASHKKATTYRRYTIIYCDKQGKEIRRFRNCIEAGYELKLSPSVVSRICRGKVVPRDYVLKYGEKELQPINFSCPKYQTRPVNAKRRVMPFPDISTSDIYDVDL